MLPAVLCISPATFSLNNQLMWLCRWSKLSPVFGYSLQTPLVSTSAFDAVADALWPDRHPPARRGGFGYLHYAVRDEFQAIDAQEFYTQFSPISPLRSEYEMKVWQQYERARQDVIQRGVSADVREQQLAVLKECKWQDFVHVEVTQT